jgi:hypothetical protein
MNITEEIHSVANALAFLIILAGYAVAAFTVIQIATGTVPTAPEAALWVSAGTLIGSGLRFVVDNLKGATNA